MISFHSFAASSNLDKRSRIKALLNLESIKLESISTEVLKYSSELKTKEKY